MKKSRQIVLSTIFLFLFLSAGNVFAQSAEDTKFQKTVETYLDEFWKFYPTSGTIAGYFKYNDRLEDLSSGTISKRHDALDKYHSDFMTKIDRSKLTPENQQAFNTILNYLDLEFVRFESLDPWEYNPLFYNDIIINSIHSLLTKEFASIDSRVKSATERAKVLPVLIKKAKDNLKNPAQTYTETAIKQIPYIIDFYKSEVPGLIANASEQNKQLLLAEINKLIPVLEDYQRYLKNELLPRSTGNFRLGPDVHRRLIQILSGTAISQEEMISRAQADFKNIRREMFLVCIPLHKMMYPETDIEQLGQQLGGDQDRIYNTIIQNVFNKIKVFHPTKDDLVEKISASAENLKKFAGETKLFPVPAENLIIKPMPLYFSGLSLTRLIRPGAYEAQGPYTLEMMTIPPDWSPEKAQSFLEEYNKFYIDVITAQKVFPGSFVPLANTRKSSDLVMKLYPNQALSLGWPVYLQGNLVTEGYGDYDLRLRLNQLKLMLDTTMSFIIDLNMHQGTMTKDQVIKYLTIQGFQTEAEAERKWDYLVLNPGMGALPYIGLEEILDLEKDVKMNKGQAFNRSDFLTKLISFGAVPPSQLRLKVIQ